MDVETLKGFSEGMCDATRYLCDRGIKNRRILAFEQAQAANFR